MLINRKNRAGASIRGGARDEVTAVWEQSGGPPDEFGKKTKIADRLAKKGSRGNRTTIQKKKGAKKYPSEMIVNSPRKKVKSGSQSDQRKKKNVLPGPCWEERFSQRRSYSHTKKRCQREIKGKISKRKRGKGQVCAKEVVVVKRRGKDDG